jgi:hydrogenase expression/formation protein HypC
MCLGVPGRIIQLGDESGVPVAVVDFGGATKSVCLVYTPGAGLGDHVIVHAGFAIATVDENAAAEALALWAELEAGAGGPPTARAGEQA